MTVKRSAYLAAGPEAGLYWDCSTRPLTSLVFVAPFLLAYECGIVLLGPEAMRNGADVWLRQLLDVLGFGQYFLLPLVTCAILLGWHHLTQHRWHVAANVLGGMLLESGLLGSLLLGIAQLQAWLFFAAGGAFATSSGMPASLSEDGVRVIGFFGAGIYEELLFRLVLLSAMVGLLRFAGESRRASWIVAILMSSLVFSAAHFQFLTPGGDPFTWYSFLFRALAGIFFSLLFVCRGFGITVGAHALYDIFVGVLLG
jgi:membrane protease YdiL (CAAX protease family)